MAARPKRKYNMSEAEFKVWFNAQLVPEGDCLLWPGAKIDADREYGVVRCEGKVRRTHHVAYWMKHGVWPEQVNHHCDTPACCNPEHVYAGTQQDNVDDMMRRGRHRPHFGSANHFAALRERQVVAIRRQAKEGATYAALANRFKVSENTIWRIVKRHNWRMAA